MRRRAWALCEKEVNAVEFESPFDELGEVDDAASLAMEEFDPPELIQAANEALPCSTRRSSASWRCANSGSTIIALTTRRPATFIAGKTKTSPSHKGRELGHWSRECPQRQNSAAVTALKSASTPKSSADDDWATLFSPAIDWSFGVFHGV